MNLLDRVASRTQHATVPGVARVPLPAANCRQVGGGYGLGRDELRLEKWARDLPHNLWFDLHEFRSSVDVWARAL